MLFISILLVVSYVGTAILKEKTLPESISALVYILPEGRWRWLWSAWLALVTVFMTPALVSAMTTAVGLLVAGATIVCLAMVAAIPLLPGYHNKWHYGIGIAAGILSQVCVALVSHWWLMAWILWVAVCVRIATSKEKTIFDGKGVFIAEAVCWLALTGSLVV